MMTPPPHDAPPAAVSFRTCVIAALPELGLGLLYVLALQDLYLPGMGPGVFAPLLQVELLALLATLFLGGIGLTRAETAQQALGRRTLFWAVFGLFWLGATENGWVVGLGFMAALLATNVGLLLTWRTPTAALQLLARSLAAFGVMLVSLGLAGQRGDLADWRATTATYLTGSFYFLTLAVLEMTGLFLRTIPRLATRLPRDTALPGELAVALRQGFAFTGRQVERGRAALLRRIGPAGK